ncbi:ubiquitin carboxyl-terminal hydrolase 17-like protein E [Frankliniella occidentalis]|uniref:Ubiquitin carboxyl-terminal hydrolase 36 n=1 Tax=Frankliniella occidentalis TaxID=133901 RepID=A0A9C6WUF1_FRAOC|nr:ubiquitin carboxyl-terminal hydrolase 17-like protein E [Frankliniella occidentalis]
MLKMRSQHVFLPLGIVNLLRKVSKDNLVFGREEDPHEFLTSIHQTLQAELLMRETKKGNKPDFCTQQTTAVGEIFGGWNLTVDQCQSCRLQSHTYNPISHLFVSCEVSIQCGIDRLLTQPEVIEDFTCSKGCEKTVCHRTTTVHSYPKVLKVVLKRFVSLKISFWLPKIYDG